MFVHFPFEEDLRDIYLARELRVRFPDAPTRQRLAGMTDGAIMMANLRCHSQLAGIDLYMQEAEPKTRQVPIKKYVVKQSTAMNRLSTLPRRVSRALKEVKKRLRNGEDVSMYLPDYALRTARGGKAQQDPARDEMLNHWGIRHLHLQPFSTVRSNGLVERADYLLFFRVHHDTVYFIDVRRHDAPTKKKWLDDELLHIELESFADSPLTASRRGALMAVNEFDGEDRFERYRVARKKSFNTFPVYKGRLVIPPDAGVTALGAPAPAVLAYTRLRRTLLQERQALCKGALSPLMPLSYLAYAEFRITNLKAGYIEVTEIRQGRSYSMEFR